MGLQALPCDSMRDITEGDNFPFRDLIALIIFDNNDDDDDDDKAGGASCNRICIS